MEKCPRCSAENAVAYDVIRPLRSPVYRCRPCGHTYAGPDPVLERVKNLVEKFRGMADALSNPASVVAYTVCADELEQEVKGGR